MPKYNVDVFNAVVISDYFHTHLDYDTFYKNNCDKFGGFLGIHEFVHNMAQFFTEQEKGITWNESTEWDFTDFVGSWVDKIIKTNSHDYETLFHKTFKHD